MPSISTSHGPSARWMKTGSPPTPPKARAGLLTPPGMTRWAREKAFLLALRDMLKVSSTVFHGKEYHHHDKGHDAKDNPSDRLPGLGLGVATLCWFPFWQHRRTRADRQVGRLSPVEQFHLGTAGSNDDADRRVGFRSGRKGLSPCSLRPRVFLRTGSRTVNPAKAIGAQKAIHRPVTPQWLNVLGGVTMDSSDSVASSQDCRSAYEMDTASELEPRNSPAVSAETADGELDVINWDGSIPLPPPRPLGAVRGRLQKPLPAPPPDAEDPWAP